MPSQAGDIRLRQTVDDDIQEASQQQAEEDDGDGKGRGQDDGRRRGRLVGDFFQPRHLDGFENAFV